jgi:hypothetical protein
MDVAREAFIRAMALARWRDLTARRGTAGVAAADAIRGAGRFPGRGRYEPLWVSRWEAEVVPQAGLSDPGPLFAAVERAVAGALAEEEAARMRCGDRPLDLDAEYRGFLDAALGRLAREAGGGLES